jgi:hypothetical protein
MILFRLGKHHQPPQHKHSVVIVGYQPRQVIVGDWLFLSSGCLYCLSITLVEGSVGLNKLLRLVAILRNIAVYP